MSRAAQVVDHVSGSLTATGPVQEAPCSTGSTTLQELRRVSRKMARDTVLQLENGYRAQSGSTVLPAVRNDLGCVLAQKVPNRAENGYVQIPPVGFTTAMGSGTKAKPQNAHRLAVIAYKSDEEVRRLLYDDSMHASHLCHDPVCINPEHLVVEDKPHNEMRKICKGHVVVETTFNGVLLRMPPARPCTHQPLCLFPVERRVAQVVQS